MSTVFPPPLPRLTSCSQTTSLRGAVLQRPRLPPRLPRSVTGNVRRATLPATPLVQPVGNGRENHARLEQQQSLDVERALVVQQPAPAAEDQLGHDYDRDGVRLRRDRSEVAEQRLADVAERRLVDLQLGRDSAFPPLAADAGRL